MSEKELGTQATQAAQSSKNLFEMAQQLYNGIFADMDERLQDLTPPQREAYFRYWLQGIEELGEQIKIEQRKIYEEFIKAVEELIKKYPNSEEAKAQKNKIIAMLTDEKLTPDIQQRLCSLLIFQTTDSGQNVINQSPFTKALIKGVQGEIFLGANAETGEEAIITLLNGYLKPYEKELLECITKFKLDGQTTEQGKTYFTLGQLYRALRHGAGTISPQKEQKEALLAALIELSNDDRKIAFKLNKYLQVWGGFEMRGGRFRIIGFDELYGKIRGQEDILIILDDTPFICALAENLRMLESVPQEIKSIKQRKYTLALKSPIEINGKKVKKRSFTSNEKRRQFCQKYGITENNIASHSETVRPWDLTENRINLRAVILDFVYSYIRARAANKPHSNKLPYSAIFERCEVDTSKRMTVSRAKDDIATILTHLTSCADLPELKAWKEYTNKGEKNANGIEIFLELPKIEG